MYRKPGVTKERLTFYLLSSNREKLQELMASRGETNLSAFINYLIESSPSAAEHMNYAESAKRAEIAACEKRIEKLEKLLIQMLEANSR